MKDVQKKSHIDSKKVSVVIKYGVSLLELSKSANSIFGKLLVVEYLCLMGMTTVGAFLGLNIFKAVSARDLTLILLSMGSYTALISYAIRFHSYARVGQNLCDAYKDITDSLDELLMHDEIGDYHRRKLESLINRFSTRSPIRPLDMFDMNYAHLAVLSNIMFTYSIILMQFKGY